VAGVTGALPSPEFWAGRRVLVTGHTGFKGAWLSLWLRAMGAEATGLSLASEPGSLGAALGIEDLFPSLEVDIRQRQALAAAVASIRPELVLHLAAQSLVRRSYRDPVETFATNVMGTAHLLEAVRAAPEVRGVLVVTSDKCYENRDWAWPYREIDPLGGHDPYSASKAGTELVAAAWRRSFLAGQGVALATARAGNVIGGGDQASDRLVPDCIRAFASGLPVPIRNPASTRPWQHVLDPLCGYLVLAERLHAGEPVADAWNFGPGPEGVRPVRDVVEALAELWGEGAGWTADAGDHPREAGLLAVDSSLARARLGWRPRLPFPAALRMTARWYKRHAQGADPRRLMEDDIAAFTAGDLPC